MNPRRIDFELQPGTGKALEIHQGEVIAIEQMEGGQCVDFNCFNLHDYKERLHVGRTRTAHGIHPTRGDFLWSAPPRERQMMFILSDTARCNDTLFPGCSAYLYESRYGFGAHTNCHDIQSEAQREYGLTPDDVHDSFNFFMNTEVSPLGRPVIHRQTTKAGDFVELLALMDVLAVPNICGDDVMLNSNFSLKPVRISVRQATEAEIGMVSVKPRLRSQRLPSDFKISRIKVDRKLVRDPDYQANFANTPVLLTDLVVELNDGEYRALRQSQVAEIYGADEGALLRDVVFSWIEQWVANNPGRI
jgi:uncharacterized protein